MLYFVQVGTFAGLQKLPEPQTRHLVDFKIFSDLACVDLGRRGLFLPLGVAKAHYASFQ
jgi:hypothetical protein